MNSPALLGANDFFVAELLPISEASSWQTSEGCASARRKRHSHGGPARRDCGGPTLCRSCGWLTSLRFLTLTGRLKTGPTPAPFRYNGLHEWQRTSLGSRLARTARGNDPRELDRLFGACRNYLQVVARAQVESWLRAKVDASDLIQQTLLEAYRDFKRFNGTTEGEWLAWLRQILTHNALNFVRQFNATGKRQIGREFSVDQLQAEGSGPGLVLAAPGESPSENCLRRERELLLADALAQLPEDYREVISLRNLQRLSFDEVAQRMGRSRPAVQMLWGRALERLQQVFSTEIVREAQTLAD